MRRSDESEVPWRPLRGQSRWLFTAAIVLAVLVVVVARWDGPLWAKLVLALAVAVGGLVLRRRSAAATQRDRRIGVVVNSTRTIHGDGRLERVCEVDLARWGVRRTDVEVGYVRRDDEAQLLGLLDAGEPVLVVGHSMAGKTRMAAEVLREHFGERRVVMPSVPDGLSQLAAEGERLEGAVVWLDDLDRYLGGEGIRTEWIDRLRGRGNLVVATMRPGEHDRHRGGGKVPSVHAETLERFEVLHLLPDPAERERMAAQVDESGLSEGITRYGLGEYVGGGYLAIQRLTEASGAPHPEGHPLGVAMVRAAVDWRRVGLDVIPALSLEALAPAYLPERYRYDLSEDAATAKSWAMEYIAGNARLLVPADDHGGTRAFDYILDFLSPANDEDEITADDVPERTWHEAVIRAPAERLMMLAATAYEVGENSHAEAAWRRLADDPDHLEQGARAAYNLGILFGDQEQLDEAEDAYRQAIASGHPKIAPQALLNLGVLYSDRGKLDEAEATYWRAIASGHDQIVPGAACNLGALLVQRDRTEEAEAAYQQATAFGHPEIAPAAALSLGDLLSDRDQVAEAEDAYRQAMTSDEPDTSCRAALGLGDLLRGQDRLEEAEKAYRHAATSEEPTTASRAAFGLADAVASRGDLEQAEEVERRALTLIEDELVFQAGLRPDEASTPDSRTQAWQNTLA